MFFQRAIAAVLILFPLVTYAYGLEQFIEHGSSDSSSYEITLMWLLALLLSSAAYDGMKAALFMPAKRFKAFYGKILESLVAIICIVACVAVSIALLTKPAIPMWLPAFVDIVAMLYIPWAIATIDEVASIARENG